MISVYGTTREVLEVLLEAYPESITKRENNGRNPLHLAMVNPHRKSSPNVVGFLLDVNAVEIINVHDDENNLPIHLLKMASKFPEEKIMERKATADCLKLYLNARPNATADFLSAIQTLPEWLRDIAVISDHIQNILNHKIAQRFPTMLLISEFVFLIMAIVVFEVTTSQTIDYIFGDGGDSRKDPAIKELVSLLFLAGFYFLVRELIQIVSLATLGNGGSWFTDMGNWLDVTLIALIFYFGGVMLTITPESSESSKNTFRSLSAITKGIMWCCVIGFLKSTQVEFSVFVSGVFYVVQRLASFLVALAVILLMFSQMFYIIYAETDECDCNINSTGENRFPHCEFKWSLLKVYTMLMGEIGE